MEFVLAWSLLIPKATPCGGGFPHISAPTKAKAIFWTSAKKPLQQQAAICIWMRKAITLLIPAWRDYRFAVAVPGSVAGLTMAQHKFGRLSLSQDMQPAIKLASEGFRLDAQTAEDFQLPILAKFPDSYRIFQRNGNFYREGEMFRQPELARTLRAIAKGGADAFYHGALAAEFVAFMKKNGGLITAADLASYKPVFRAPIEGDYRGFHLTTAAPPSSGGIALLEMLNELENTRARWIPASFPQAPCTMKWRPCAARLRTAPSILPIPILRASLSRTD